MPLRTSRARRESKRSALSSPRVAAVSPDHRAPRAAPPPSAVRRESQRPASSRGRNCTLRSGRIRRPRHAWRRGRRGRRCARRRDRIRKRRRAWSRAAKRAFRTWSVRRQRPTDRRCRRPRCARRICPIRKPHRACKPAQGPKCMHKGSRTRVAEARAAARSMAEASCCVTTGGKGRAAAIRAPSRA
jgi:hypothetical protein